MYAIRSYYAHLKAALVLGRQGKEPVQHGQDIGLGFGEAAPNLFEQVEDVITDDHAGDASYNCV